MIRKLMIVAASAVLLINTAFADVSGNWGFAVEITGVGAGNAQVTMQQAADDAITGTYSGQLGNTGFTGKAEGNAFEFTLSTEVGMIKYEGELQADGTLKGTLNLGDMGQGTFVGTRR
jgi:hypothetical protein